MRFRSDSQMEGTTHGCGRVHYTANESNNQSPTMNKKSRHEEVWEAERSISSTEVRLSCVFKLPRSGKMRKCLLSLALSEFEKTD